MNTFITKFGQSLQLAALGVVVTLTAACGGNDRGNDVDGARPTAFAGADQEVSTRQFVQLDAGGSRNAAGGGDGIEFQWRQLSGPAVTFEEGAGIDTASPRFISPWVAQDEVLLFEVTVSAKGASDTDQVIVSIDGCQVEAGDIFTDCLAPNYGPFLSYEADDFGVGGVHFDGIGDYHVQWQLVETDELGHGTVIQAQWNGNDPFDEYAVNGWFGLIAGDSTGIDLSEFGDGALQFDMRVINQGLQPGYLLAKMECFYPCTSDEAWVKEPAELNEWQTYYYSLAYLRESGLDLTSVSTPFIIHPAWGFQQGQYVLQIDNIRLLDQYQPDQGETPDVPATEQVLMIYQNGFVDSDNDGEPDYLHAAYNAGAAEALLVAETAISDTETVLELQFLEPASQSSFYVIPTSRMAADLSIFHHGNIVFDINVVSYGGNAGFFEFNTYCFWPCKALPWYNLGRPAEGEWQTLSVPVSELVARGVELDSIFNAFFLGFSGPEQQGMTVQLNNIRWQFVP